MKIGFFGTPEIASYCLEKLIEKYDISFVVTCVDKPKGRCLINCSSPVKKVAERENIPVVQTCTLKEDDTIEKIISYEADIYVVVAFGQLIPEVIFAHPSLGSINLHPSLLPLYRGAAPIQWSIINGEKQTGITIQKIDEKLDAGDIVLQENIELSENTTSCELYERVLPRGAEMLIEAIEGLKDGSINPVEQKHENATYCGKITTETSKIDWKKTAAEIHNLIRGMNPRPGAWTNHNGKRIKIWESVLPVDEGLPELKPGEVRKYQKKRLLIGTMDGNLEIKLIQPENKKKMDALSFLNGYRMGAEDLFE